MIPKILVLSGKGGVGKSTTSTLTAEWLSTQGRVVGLVDFDVACPNVLQFLTGKIVTTQKTDVAGVHPALTENPDLQVVSLAFELPDGMAMLRGDEWRGKMVRDLATHIVWEREPEVVVVDMPPGTSGEHLAMLKEVPGVVGAIVVTTGHPAALEDARRAIDMLREVRTELHPDGMRILGAVENMYAVKCPKCGTQVRVHGAYDVRDALGVPVIARIQFKKGIAARDFAAVGMAVLDAVWALRTSGSCGENCRESGVKR